VVGARRAARDVVDVVAVDVVRALRGSLRGSAWLASASSWPTGWLEQLDVARLWLGVACSAVRCAARSAARAAPLLPN